jgi:triacylglycerol lipase
LLEKISTLEGGLVPFDPEFEIATSLVLAQAAYDVANGLPPKLPNGFAKVAEIVADLAKMEQHIITATTAQQALFRGMMLESVRPNVFGFVAKSADAVAVCFRGTQSPEEWVKDFDFLHVPYQAVPDFGDVHQGFQQVYDTVQASAIAGVAACGARARTLVIGHSLGAALTILCAPDLAINELSGPPPEVHNFAGPRLAAPDDPDIFKSTFASKFGATISTCIRIVNRWDIVPHLPPAVAAYQHVGQGVDIDGGFTLDLARAHNLQQSYLVGLERLVPQPAAALRIAAVA